MEGIIGRAKNEAGSEIAKSYDSNLKSYQGNELVPLYTAQNMAVENMLRDK